MKNKVIAMFFVLILCVSFVLPVSAQTGKERMVDDAGLLLESEQREISDMLDDMSRTHQFDVVIHTTNSTNGQYIRDYADDYYDYNGYGFGSNFDGCILVVDMSGRDWWISTCGYGTYVFTDAGIDYIGDKIEGDLSDGDYYDAFTTYAELCDDYIIKASTSAPYDSGTLPKDPYNWFFGIVFSLVVGFVIALIAVLVMKGKLKSVRRQPAAKDYLVAGSMNVTSSRDMFLYRNVTRRAKPKESSGSSTHTSSSGRSHGGGGGSF